MKKIGLYFLLLLIILSISGCGLMDGISSINNGKGEQTKEVEKTKENNNNSADSTQPAKTEKDSETKGIDEQSPESEKLEVEDMSGLKTYRQLTVITNKNNEGAGDNSVEETFDIEKQARHLITKMYIEDMEMVMEMIIIGKKSWMKSTSTVDWIEQENENAPVDTMIPASAKNWEKSKLVFVGDEEKNGVNCKKYKGTFAADGFDQVTEVWIANQDGIPKITISVVNEVTNQSGEQKGDITLMTVDIFDVNQPVDINPPENIAK